jgi:hypothetical protein
MSIKKPYPKVRFKGGGIGIRTQVLPILTINDYTLRTTFKLMFRNFTIPLFLKWFGLLRTNPPLVPFKIETTSYKDFCSWVNVFSTRWFFLIAQAVTVASSRTNPIAAILFKTLPFNFYLRRFK